MSMSLGLTPGLSSKGHTASSSVTYLPTTGLLAARGMKRMVAGYNGPLFQLGRNTGTGGTMDVYCAAGTDDPDWAAVAAFWATGWVSLNILQRYDQSGNGYTETLAGAGPTIDMAQGQTTPNSNGAICNGGGSSGRWSTAIALDRQNVTIVQAIQYRSVLDPSQGLWSINNGGGTLISGMYCGGTLTPRYNNGTDYSTSSGGTSGNDGTFAMRSNPTTLGWSSSPTEARTFLNGTSKVLPTIGVETPSVGATFVEPYLTTGGLNAKIRHFGSVIYTAQSQANTQAIIDAMNSIFSIPTVFTSRLVIDGDSIVSGIGTTYHRNLGWHIMQAKPNVELYTLGVSGSTLASHYTNRAKWVEQLYTTAYGAGKCVLILEASTNDMSTGSTDTQVLASMTSFVSAELVKGFKVVVSNTLPRADGLWNATMEGYRFSNATNYRASVLANSFGADAVVDVADPASVMGALAAPTSTSPKLYNEAPAGLHPTDYGYSQYYTEYTAAAPIAAL